jgi:hypothetical protein
VFEGSDFQQLCFFNRAQLLCQFGHAIAQLGTQLGKFGSEFALNLLVGIPERRGASVAGILRAQTLCGLLERVVTAVGKNWRVHDITSMVLPL